MPTVAQNTGHFQTSSRVSLDSSKDWAPDHGWSSDFMARGFHFELGISITKSLTEEIYQQSVVVGMVFRLRLEQILKLKNRWVQEA